MRTQRALIFALVIGLTAIAPIALAVKVADITRLDGQRTNTITGFGLVIGLKGTGDGGDFSAAIAPLASLLKNFADPATARELANAQNVAAVMLSATIPSNGVRQGDHIDVYVTSFGKASSLKGGRLISSPMMFGTPGKERLFAMAAGPMLLEDPSTPTGGIIKGGCVMEVDLLMPFVTDAGKFTLILEDPAASWTTASSIAKIINDAGDGDVGETLAVAVDPKNVVVSIPRAERDRPDSFISRVQRLPVPMLTTEARVTINDKTETLILTGDCEISPVVISHKGLTISTILPAPVPSVRAPIISRKDVVALDTTNTGGAKLQDLLAAMDAIKVPAADRIAIVRELYKSGKLHAKLIPEPS